MNSKLNKELMSRSLQLTALAELQPDDRIARITWDRIQDDLEQADNMVYGMHFCIANIDALIKTSFKETENTIAALEACHQLITTLGWNKEEILAMERSSMVFIDYIKDVVTMYNDIKQNHCENAQCILAMNMNSMLLQDLEYVMKQNPQRQRSLTPALEAAAQLRVQMVLVFDWNASEA
ncbi:hypothetical protein SynPROS91_00550 [Synechococcus sp. PROS-9-1]|uniref:hypothetical protein n=1 Tax=Synechococcus sp. PROS-9-1 TaxID=1968775 RepID=UPI001644AAA1|nr:hypothetical protein [Synechococcus sp. PROS-9-1]QNJ30960.1 hypothetical protein SynPROS91_00550 [Synechococcus sp. PROS-9-1]